jgi:hypothetical protein
MTQTEFILLYHDAVYQIVSGSLKGNKTKIKAIHIPERLIESAGGKLIQFEEIKAELTPIADITEEQAAWFFKTYWGSTRIMRGDLNQVVVASKESFMHIVNGAWYISGDLVETNRLLKEMRKYHVDVDDAIAKGFAINKTINL